MPDTKSSRVCPTCGQSLPLDYETYNEARAIERDLASQKWPTEEPAEASQYVTGRSAGQWQAIINDLVRQGVWTSDMNKAITARNIEKFKQDGYWIDANGRYRTDAPNSSVQAQVAASGSVAPYTEPVAEPYYPGREEISQQQRLANLWGMPALTGMPRRQ